MRIFHVSLVLLVFSLVVLADDKLDWKPISAEELSMKTPKVEADADVEAIFVEVKAENKPNFGAEYHRYYRLKIFNERGIENYNKLEFPDNDTIENIGIRIISPDGKITEIVEKEFLVKEVVKTKFDSFKIKVAPIPNLQIGSILEYQYKESYSPNNIYSYGLSRNLLPILDSPDADDLRGLTFSYYSPSSSSYNFAVQINIPIQSETFYVKLKDEAEKMTVITNNLDQKIELKKHKENGFYYFTLENLKPFTAEPFLPPDFYIRQRVIIKKTGEKKIATPDEYWAYVAGRNSERIKRIQEKLSKNEIIANKAKELTANAKSDEEKLKVIYEFCQKQIKNWTYLRPKFSAEENKKLVNISFRNEPLEKILETKIGSSIEINNLFGAMITSLGLETRLSLGFYRETDLGIDLEKKTLPTMNVCGMAVKLDGKWKTFIPSNPFMPFGKNNWQYEGQNQLLVGEKDSLWNKVEATPEKNLFKRTANFTLNENGELEGEVKIELSGYRSFEAKEQEIRNKKEDLEKSISNEIWARIPDAKLAIVKLENYGEYDKPYIYSYRIKIPNYASITGKRIFFQPNYFKYKVAPLFTSEKRIHPIYMPTPWLENDEITFTLPKGYKFESFDANGLADPNKIGMLTMNLENDENQNSIKFKRQFYFGKGGQTLYSTKVYSALKELFDKFNLADARVVSLVKE